MAQSTKYTIKDTFEIGAAKTWATTDVNIVADTIRIVNHGYKTGDPVGLSTTGTVPAGLTALTTAYYLYPVDASTVKFYNSRANAVTHGTTGLIDLTTVGTGVGTMQKGALGISLGKIIPANHVVVNGTYKVVTTGASPTGVDNGSLAISIEGANDLVSAALISAGTTWDAAGLIQMIPDLGTVGDYKTTTTDRHITFTTAADAWTAGKLHVYLDVVPTLE